MKKPLFPDEQELSSAKVLIIDDEPFGAPRLIDGPREATRLDLVIAQVRIGIERMTSSESLRELRRAIQEYRRVQTERRKRARW